LLQLNRLQYRPTPFFKPLPKQSLMTYVSFVAGERVMVGGWGRSTWPEMGLGLNGCGDSVVGWVWVWGFRFYFFQIFSQYFNQIHMKNIFPDGRKE
jgi:hypothetical protein